MKKVSGSLVVTPVEALESPLPPRIREALGGAGRRGEGGSVGAERRRWAECGA